MTSLSSPIKFFISVYFHRSEIVIFTDNPLKVAILCKLFYQYSSGDGFWFTVNQALIHPKFDTFSIYLPTS